MSETSVEKIVSESNDNTFNVVIGYRYYDDDDYIIVIKNGGLTTENSISKPVYKVITPEKEYQYEQLSSALECVDWNRQGFQPNQSNIRPILKKKIGNYLFLTNHIIAHFFDDILNSAESIIGRDHIDFYKVKEMVDSIKKTNIDVNDKVNYEYSIATFDRLCRAIDQMKLRNPQFNEISHTLKIYNNILPRY